MLIFYTLQLYVLPFKQFRRIKKKKEYFQMNQGQTEDFLFFFKCSNHAYKSFFSISALFWKFLRSSALWKTKLFTGKHRFWARPLSAILHPHFHLSSWQTSQIKPAVPFIAALSNLYLLAQICLSLQLSALGSGNIQSKRDKQTSHFEHR